MTKRRYQPIIAHVGGPAGAGKTTLGKRLQRRFPQIVVKDLDDFSGPNRHSPEWWGPTTQRKYRRWLSRQTKPIVLVGFERQYVVRRRHQIRPAEMPIPNGTPKYLLRTGALRSAWRAVKRHRKNEGHWPPLRPVLKGIRLNRMDRRQYLRLGYAKKSPRQIERAIQRHLQGQP